MNPPIYSMFCCDATYHIAYSIFKSSASCWPAQTPLRPVAEGSRHADVSAYIAAACPSSPPPPPQPHRWDDAVAPAHRVDSSLWAALELLHFPPPTLQDPFRCLHHCLADAEAEAGALAEVWTRKREARHCPDGTIYLQCAGAELHLVDQSLLRLQQAPLPPQEGRKSPCRPARRWLTCLASSSPRPAQAAAQITAPTSQHDLVNSRRSMWLIIYSYLVSQLRASHEDT